MLLLHGMSMFTKRFGRSMVRNWVLKLAMKTIWVRFI